VSIRSLNLGPGPGPRAHPEAGLILVNVLVALALGSALVMLMLTSQDGAIDRARRASAAVQAEALALGAETSVLVALRRDMIEAPEADGYGEPWALVAQEEVVLDTGRFAVTIRDAQAGLDLNGLAAGGIAQAQALARLVAALDLPADTGARILAALRDGPLTRLGQVEGLDEQARERLGPYVSFLPIPGAVNLNTADPLLMGALLQNRTAARRLADLREREGSLSRQDLLDLGLVPGGGTGFRSDVWDVTTLAEVDGVSVTLTSRLVRRRGTGTVEVIVASRRFGAWPEGDLPPVPPDP